MSHTTSETLNIAADLIESRGWAGRDLKAEDPWGGGARGTAPICLEGGIIAALGIELPPLGRGGNAARNAILNKVPSCPAFVAVKDYLGLPGSLYMWNDDRSRAAHEVIEVLRATALIEAAREREAAEVSA